MGVTGLSQEFEKNGVCADLSEHSCPLQLCLAQGLVPILFIACLTCSEDLLYSQSDHKTVGAVLFCRHDVGPRAGRLL